MNLQNGYKVIYEKAADGKRTFYASKTGICDPSVDKQLGDAFVDTDYIGKTIYEYKGSFYVSKGKTPAYDENGIPTDERLDIFDEVFVAAEASSNQEVAEEPTVVITDEIEPETESEPETLPEEEEEEEL